MSSDVDDAAAATTADGERLVVRVTLPVGLGATEAVEVRDTVDIAAAAWTQARDFLLVSSRPVCLYLPVG